MIQGYSGTRGTRLAKKSSFFRAEDSYRCQQAWPHDCFVQCGDDGIVMPRDTIGPMLGKGDLVPLIKGLSGGLSGSYRTAFFEAFPTSPNTFIRGEGKDIGEAELECWKKFTKITSCQKHEFERRGREDGYCFCKNCGLGGLFMEPTTICPICGVANYYHKSNDGKMYCEKCCQLLKGERCWSCGKADNEVVFMKSNGVFSHPRCSKDEKDWLKEL